MTILLTRNERISKRNRLRKEVERRTVGRTIASIEWLDEPEVDLFVVSISLTDGTVIEFDADGFGSAPLIVPISKE